MNSSGNMTSLTNKILFTHLLLILFTVPFYSFSETQEYIFEQLKVEDGLSQSTVFSSLQDDEGYLWFGTGNGLNKYDGYEFQVFYHDPNDSTSLSDNGITALTRDKNGTIWIGTVEGYLNRYNKLNETFTRLNIKEALELVPVQDDDYFEYPLSFSRNQNYSVTTIAEDKTGNLWIGTWGFGIIVLDKQLNKIVHLYNIEFDPGSLPTNRIMDILVDSKGTVWIGTFGGGLCKAIINGSQEKPDISFIEYNHDPLRNTSLTDDKIISLYEDSGNNLWIGTYDGGLNKLTEMEKRNEPADTKFSGFTFDPSVENCLCENTVMTITEDKVGNLWIGTFGGGIDKLNLTTGIFTHYKNDPFDKSSIADNDIISILIDESGIIWAGSHLGEGLTKIQKNKAKFNLLSHQPGNPQSLSDNVVWSIHQDKKGSLWIGTYRNGLNKLNKEKKVTNRYSFKADDPNSLSNNHVRAIEEDSYENLWLGTYSGGLNIFNKSSGKVRRIVPHLDEINWIAGVQVQDILIDKNNTYWLGVFGGGLNKIKAEGNPFNSELIFTNYFFSPDNPNSISDNRVYKIFKDSDGILWIGTYGGGLNRFDPVKEEFKSYRYDANDKTTLSENRIVTIAESYDGYLWIGTTGGGLNRFDKKTEEFKRYSQKDGLTSSTVYGIVEDNKGNLWLSTDNGIFKYDRDAENFINYDLKDGVQSLEFSGGAYFKTDEGEIYFGGINGVNYFYPDSIKENKYIPQIVITSVEVVNNKFRGNPTELELDHNQNFITFKFSALDFTDPLDNEYAYMLEGIDSDWQMVSADLRLANYTNLPPGSYKFKVRGTNSDGIWNDEAATIIINISPPFWQTWWFLLISIIFILLVVYYISTIRIKNLLAIEKLKTKLAADLHDNVGSGLTEISILSELAAQRLQTDSDNKSGELKKISELSRQLVDNMSDIVWVVNPHRDSLHDLVLRLKDNYSDFLNSLGITFKTTNLEKLKDIKLPMNMKQNLYLIFKEGINNAVKHSRCSLLTLDANVRDNVLEISLKDNGIGINETDIERGNGLKNIMNRARSIGGKLKWNSTSDKGTSLIFIGKIKGFNRIKSLFVK